MMISVDFRPRMRHHGAAAPEVEISLEVEPSGAIQTGSRMPRPKLSDVAKAAGLSVSTVSMALRDYPDVSAATRMRVRELCQQVNYRPRRKATRGGRSRDRHK